MTPAEYASVIVLPTVREQLGDKLDIRKGMLSCILTFHIAEHIAHAEGYPNASRVCERIRTRCRDEFDVLQGICNGSKHAKTKPHLSHQYRAGAAIVAPGFALDDPEAGWDKGVWDGPALAVEHDGKRFTFDQCVIEVLRIFGELYPHHFPADVLGLGAVLTLSHNHSRQPVTATSNVPFIDFYTRLVNGYHGANVNNHQGDRPRGAFTEGQPGQIRLMAVLLNPGQPLKSEADWQGAATGAQLAEIVWNSSGQVFKGEHYSRTLTIMRRDVSQLLGRPFDQCTRAFMFTNLVRCTTANNRRPDAEAIAIGAKWLREEIGLWRPHKVIAYGNEVAKSMTTYGVPFDAMVPHPAALGDWTIAGRRQQRLDEVRRQLGLG